MRRVKPSELEHAIDRLFDALLDVEIPIALDALARVEQEFQRVAKEPAPLSADAVEDYKHKEKSDA